MITAAIIVTNHANRRLYFSLASRTPRSSGPRFRVSATESLSHASRRTCIKRRWRARVLIGGVEFLSADSLTDCSPRGSASTWRAKLWEGAPNHTNVAHDRKPAEPGPYSECRPNLGETALAAQQLLAPLCHEYGAMRFADVP